MGCNRVRMGVGTGLDGTGLDGDGMGWKERGVEWGWMGEDLMGVRTGWDSTRRDEAGRHWGRGGWGGWGVESDGMGVHVTGRDRAGLDRMRAGLALGGGGGDAGGTG